MKAALSPLGILRRAKQFPIRECWINSDWDDEDSSGLVRLVIMRDQPDGGIVWGGYLLDVLCLGLKDTFCNANFLLRELREEVIPQVFFDVDPAPCPPELAHQLIYGAIDYAAQFGFKPQKDFKMSRHLLEPRGTLEEPYDLTFGQDGKPFFVAGPYDNVSAILAKLEKNPGPGNYDYLLPVGPSGALWDDDE